MAWLRASWVHCINCRARLADFRASARLSVAQYHDRRVDRRRHRHGHRCPPLRREARGRAGQVGHRREQARSCDHAGGAIRRDRAARRPHDGCADELRAGDQSMALQADELQPGERFHPDLPLREIAIDPGGEPERAGQDRARVHRLRQAGQSAAQLRLGGRGRVSAHIDGIRQAALRLQRNPRAL